MLCIPVFHLYKYKQKNIHIHMLKLIFLGICVVLTEAKLPIFRAVDNYARDLYGSDCNQAVWPKELSDYLQCSGAELSELSKLDKITDICVELSKSKSLQCMPLLFGLEKFTLPSKPSVCSDQEWNFQTTSMQEASNVKTEIPKVREEFSKCDQKKLGSTTSLLDEKYKQKIMNQASTNTSAGIFLICVLLLYSITN